jgi:hypothetical protein
MMGMKKWIWICAMASACNGGSGSNQLAETHIPQAIDILFVVDDSVDMDAEQLKLGRTMSGFTLQLERRVTKDYHIAVITTSIESVGCVPCDQVIREDCAGESGDNGQFHDLLGKYQGSGDKPAYSTESDPTCDIVTPVNKYCLYDEVEQKGTLVVGNTGCGFERGLAAMRMALEDPPSGFMRSDAALAVIVLSSEEDCGEVDDVYELGAAGGPVGNICYYASKGIGPEGESKSPDDPEQRPYQLAAVEEYRDFLEELKQGQAGMVKFAAIAAVKHTNDLDTTIIEYELDAESHWQIVHACDAPGCTGDYCYALPSTRYIKMAELFGIGENGFIDTICQTDFTDTMKRLATFLSCPGRFLLSKTISDPQKSNLALNGEPIPRYSCSVATQLESCQYTDDPSCSAGTCVETWSYYYPSLAEPHGAIVFAEHFDACSYAENGVLRIELLK